MPQSQRRLDRVLEPAYLEGIAARPTDELESMRAECDEIETEVSYVRRLAQARIEILRAERARRVSGADIGELVDALPRILADQGPRSDPARARLPRFLAPDPKIAWNRGLEALVTDSTLASLPLIEDSRLDESLEQLATLESEVSDARRSLHPVIDALDQELAARRRDGRR
ncbi:MAG: aerial mycelium formation protein [Acidimicrobiia bacterium]